MNFVSWEIILEGMHMGKWVVALGQCSISSKTFMYKDQEWSGVTAY